MQLAAASYRSVQQLMNYTERFTESRQEKEKYTQFHYLQIIQIKRKQIKNLFRMKGKNVHTQRVTKRTDTVA